jgi:hypothetical protein
LANRTPPVPPGLWDRFDQPLNHYLDAWCGRQHRLTRLNYSTWDPDQPNPLPEEILTESLQQKHATRVVEDIDALAIHLRLFKNIPKQDLDMLLLGETIRISGFDRVKIVLPSLGGFLLSLRKIAQLSLLLAALAMHWVAISIALMIGYALKSTLSYFQTRNRCELNLNRHLYFQKLDTNAGILATLVDDAVTQRRYPTRKRGTMAVRYRQTSLAYASGCDGYRDSTH